MKLLGFFLILLAGAVALELENARAANWSVSAFKNFSSCWKQEFRDAPISFYYRGVPVTEVEFNCGEMEGFYSFDDKRIFLDKDLNLIERELKLRHEYCHSQQSRSFMKQNQLQAEKDCYWAQLNVFGWSITSA